MKTALQCIPCMVNSYIRLLDYEFIPEQHHQQLMRNVLNFLAAADYDNSPPELAQVLQRRMRELLANNDPYAQIKKSCNDRLLKLYDSLEQQIKSSPSPFQTALRFAIAGNVIDFAAKHLLDVEETIKRSLTEPLALDHSAQLQKELDKAQSVLYIGDNSGEIVLDKLFIQTLAHPNLTFAVRGNPVLNDATIDDVQAIGLNKLCPVITTGDDAPGVVLKTSSQEFLDIFESADVVIAKGQGNLEGLIDCDRSVYFLFVAKCEYMAKRVNVPVKSFVIFNKGTDHEKK